MKVLISILLVISVAILCSDCQVSAARDRKRRGFSADCSSVTGFTQKLQDQIKSKAEDVQKIIDYLTKGEGKHTTYDELANFVDTFGPRLSGSESLDRAVKYMENKLSTEAKVKTSRAKAMIPKWEVHKQWAEIVKPVRHPMNILALGTSVGTNGTIEAEVEIIHTFDELDTKGKKGDIKGKIVVYNYKWTSYGESVSFRSQGAKRAAEYGARAALIRSVTPFSIGSPHAGMASRTIPTAAITLEDADKLQRWANRKQRTTIKLYIDSQNFDDAESANLIGDIEGTDKPEEIVLVSGHMDSWYNTDGAMDDGGGMMISYKAVETLNKLGLKGKRTMRAALWTSEEFGIIGAQQYFKDNKDQLDKFKIVMESDLGTFTPIGLSFKNFGPVGQCVVKEALKMTSAIKTTSLDSNYEGSDIEVFSDVGVPGLSLANQNDKYFWYHHTAGDSMTMQDPDALDKCTALWASSLYVLASVDVDDFRR